MDKIEVSSTNEAGDQVVDFANFDPAREEENKINSRNAELLFNVEFVPFYLGTQREHGLTDLETKIYGFVKFFTGGGKDFFVSNQRIAAELGVKAPETISRAVRVLTDKGLIHASSKVTPAGTIRKLRVDEKVIPARRKSQGGLTEKSRGVDEKVKLYIPSIQNINTYKEKEKEKEKEIFFPSRVVKEKILEEYKNEFRVARCQLTEDRSRKLNYRLKSYKPEEIMEAIRHYARSPFHTGQNDRKWIAPVDFIIRSDEQIEKGLNLNTKPVFIKPIVH